MRCNADLILKSKVQSQRSKGSRPEGKIKVQKAKLKSPGPRFADGGD